MNFELIEAAPAIDIGEARITPVNIARPRAAIRRRAPLWQALVLASAGSYFIWAHRDADFAPAAAPEPAQMAPLSQSAQAAPLTPLLEFPNAADPVRTDARLSADGTRNDRLSLGQVDSDRLALAVSLSAANAAQPPFFVAMATLAADLSASVERSATPAPGQTPRGATQWAELALRGAGPMRACLGFAIKAKTGATLAGVACGAHGAKIDRAGLDCLLDHLSLTKAGSDAGLAALVGPVSGARAACRKTAL